MKKYLIGIAILILYFGGMVCCLLFATPRWLAEIGFAVVAACLVVGSIYRIVYPNSEGVKYGGDIPFLPASWRRWVLDKPEPQAKAKV